MRKFSHDDYKKNLVLDKQPNFLIALQTLERLRAWLDRRKK